MSDYKRMVGQMIACTFMSECGKFQQRKPIDARREMVVVFDLAMKFTESGKYMMEMSIYGQDNYVEILTRTIRDTYDEESDQEVKETTEWHNWGSHDSVWRQRIMDVLNSQEINSIHTRGDRWFELRART